MPAVTQTGHQRILVDPVNRGLTSGINIGNQHFIRIIEAGAEIIEQIGKAAVPVRLNHGDQFVFTTHHAACF